MQEEIMPRQYDISRKKVLICFPFTHDAYQNK